MFKFAENIKNDLKNNSLFITIFLITIIILLIPLIQNELVYGDDMIFHLSRIQSIADSLKNGVYPIKINASMSNGFGYASSMFYPDLFLLFPAILIAFFNAGLIYSYKVFIFFLLILMFLTFYYCFKYLSNNKEIALLGTAFLMLSKFVILTLYSRFALGEFIGFIFILPAIVGLYDYLYKDFSKPQILILSFFGLINSHLITGIIVLIFCLIVFLLNIKNSIKNPKKVVKLILCVIIVLLMSIYFWLPLVEQLIHTKFNLSKSWTNIGNESYTIFDYFTNSKYDIGYSIIFTLPFMIYLFLFEEKSGNKSEWKKFFIYFVLLSIFLTFSLIWIVFNNGLNIIQFKWRLLGIITTVYIVSIVLFLSGHKECIDISKQKIVLLISFSFLIIFTLSNYKNYSVGNLKYTDENIMKNITTNIESLGGGFEYLPIEIENPLYIFQKHTNISSGNGINVLGTKNPNLRYCFNYEDKMGNIVEIPYVYYYGYVANIKTKDGNIKPLEVIRGNSGLVNLNIENEESGEVLVWYNGTKIQKISLIISVLSIFGFAIYHFYNNKKRKNSKI